jgi:hypothetical protein
MDKFVYGIVGTALLVGSGFWLLEPGEPSPTRAQSGDLQYLEEQLAELGQNQAQVLMRMAELEAEVIALASGAIGSVALLPLEEPAADTEETDLPEPRSPAQRFERNPQIAQRVEQVGLTIDEFETLETRARELYLESFEQEWYARREAWLAGESRPGSRQRLREELGDEAYDRYLYANGTPNRVRIRRVLPGSAAQLGGLEEGDVLLSYDGARLFTFEDLRLASYQGEPGDSVVVEIRRSDGLISQAVIPRGPLGISGHGGWREVPD